MYGHPSCNCDRCEQGMAERVEMYKIREPGDLNLWGMAARDWARHFEQKRQRRAKLKRAAGVALAYVMATTGFVLLSLVSCAPAVPV